MSSKTHRDEKNFNQAALDYHKAEPKGKIEVIPSKPHSSQRDLSLAYSPGLQFLVWKSTISRKRCTTTPEKEIW